MIASAPQFVSAIHMFQPQISATVQLGNPEMQNANDFRKAAEKNGIIIVPWSDGILDKVFFSRQRARVDLARATGRDLGLSDFHSLEELVRAAHAQYGWRRCQAEIGPQVLLQCQEEILGRCIHIPMTPITGQEPYIHPKVFYLLSKMEQVSLRTKICYPDDIWSPDDEWLFVVPPSGRK